MNQERTHPYYVLPHGYWRPLGGRHRSPAHLGLFALVARHPAIPEKPEVLVEYRTLCRLPEIAQSLYNSFKARDKRWQQCVVPEWEGGEL
jgi:hypothetical protein